MILSANDCRLLCAHHQKTASRFVITNRSLKISERGQGKSGCGLCTDVEYEATMVEKEGKGRLMLTRESWRHLLHGRMMDQASIQGLL
jgi:hypothetical protein